MSRTASTIEPATESMEQSVGRRRISQTRQPPWRDAPLRLKAYAIACMALVAGLLLGTIEARLGYQVWPLMIGLTGLLLGGVSLVNHWISHPINRLVSRLERLNRTGEPASLRGLPTRRTDELGRIARAVHQLGESLARQQNETATLRKTLDSRAAEATRRATVQLERLAMRDPLTDMGNRRCLDENLPSLIDAAREDPQSDLFSVLLDIDNFKPLNDTLGHAAGDEILAFLGSLIRGCARDNDLAVRLGGDEFVVLLPTGDSQRVQQFCDMIRSLFQQQARTMFPDGPQPDLSIGVAALKRDACTDGEALLALADDNLYRAKRHGKGKTKGLTEIS